uniref:Cerato-platanin 10 n=1 Tax=Moniliophthora perniciosa TaxID=153609 RepID=S4UPN0_MONPR|nr:cerato-platanin 10 [Moniliophthora perniciosa]
MKFVATIAILATSAAALSVKRRNTDGQSYKLRYINEFDNGDYSFNNVACSNGEHGMLAKKLNKFGDLPRNANGVNVYGGGVFTVSGWGDEECGSCWEVYYNDRKVRVIAVDTAQDGFNLPKKGMDELTNGQAYDLGVIEVTTQKLKPSDCGLTSMNGQTSMNGKTSTQGQTSTEGKTSTNGKTLTEGKTSTNGQSSTEGKTAS